ncbi:MAG TPA: twin-arginine translocase TatA/TatE family subunit [Pirellulales bacterium]|nr:twin-arginine translocase TatA/TatE family subunit [Pirellulales bacterium]
MNSLLGIFGVGPTELLVVGVVVLLLFGSRLPSLMRSLGRSVVEFKKGVKEIDDGGGDDEAPPGDHKT